MDLQKENDKYLVSLVTNSSATQDEINDLNFDEETGFFESNRLADWFINQINFGWRVWQAAKAQAIPAGYVLVPKEPTDAMLDAGMRGFYFPLDNGRFYTHDLIFAYRAMIEVQESAND